MESTSRLGVLRTVQSRDSARDSARQRETVDNFAEFQEKAEAWRALPQKPALPEEVRRFEVLAKDAIQNKEFEKAGNYYERGLSLQPLWPEGQFNSAVIFGEIGKYAKAVLHMKRYLALCPYVPDAQAARDKMYIWEEKSHEVNQTDEQRAAELEALTRAQTRRSK